MAFTALSGLEVGPKLLEHKFWWLNPSWLHSFWVLCHPLALFSRSWGEQCLIRRAGVGGPHGSGHGLWQSHHSWNPKVALIHCLCKHHNSCPCSAQMQLRSWAAFVPHSWATEATGIEAVTQFRVGSVQGWSWETGQWPHTDSICTASGVCVCAPQEWSLGFSQPSFTATGPPTSPPDSSSVSLLEGTVPTWLLLFHSYLILCGSFSHTVCTLFLQVLTGSEFAVRTVP